MSANVPAVVDRQPVPDDRALEEELRELAKQFPEPDWHEVARDREWFYGEANAGTLDHLRGKSVIVYNRRVVGSGDDYLVLLIQLAREYQLHPGHFYAMYHGDPFECV